MTGLMKNYKETLKDTPQPILLSQMENSIDLKALYAKANNMKVSELSETDKKNLLGLDACYSLSLI